MRRRAVRAFRDPERPRLWDRHRAIPTAAPSEPDADLRALDAFYREGRAEQWSLVGPEPAMAAWARALAPHALVEERLDVRLRAPRDLPDPAGRRAVRPGPRAALRAIRGLVAATDPRLAPFAGEWARLIAARSASALEPIVLAVREARQVVGVVAVTVAGATGWIEDLETRPDRRGHGVGRVLLLAAERAARGAGARAVALSTLATGWPTRWYEREGYRLAGAALRLRRLM